MKERTAVALALDPASGAFGPGGSYGGREGDGRVRRLRLASCEVSLNSTDTDTRGILVVAIQAPARYWLAEAAPNSTLNGESTLIPLTGAPKEGRRRHLESRVDETLAVRSEVEPSFALSPTPGMLPLAPTKSVAWRFCPGL
jgi:hypothetical protein